MVFTKILPIMGFLLLPTTEAAPSRYPVQRRTGTTGYVTAPGTGPPVYGTIPPTAPPARPSSNATNPGEVAVYFGQNRVSGDDSLGVFCNSPSVDIVVLAFINRFFGQAGLPGMNLGPYCTTPIPGTDLLSCPDLATQIQQCQANRKKVFISIGGATNTDVFSGTQQAQALADTLWGLFGEGTGYEGKRPFGNVNIDGFDLDNENNNPTGYVDLISRLRERFATAPSKKTYYISAAPQCPRPDLSLLDTVYHVDYLWPQFYNNPPCSTNSGNFLNSLQGWAQDLANHGAANTKILPGFPGAPPAAGSGYVDAITMTNLVKQARTIPSFGGIMMWDASFARSNVGPDGKTFLDSAKVAVSM